MKPIHVLNAKCTVRVCEFCRKASDTANKYSLSVCQFRCVAPGVNQDERVLVDEPCTYADSQTCNIFKKFQK